MVSRNVELFYQVSCDDGDISADRWSSNSRKSFSATKGWFALSAYAFPTEVVDNQDGYTILRLADGEVDDGSKPESLGNYVLWEMADSSTS